MRSIRGRHHDGEEHPLHHHETDGDDEYPAGCRPRPGERRLTARLPRTKHMALEHQHVVRLGVRMLVNLVFRNGRRQPGYRKAVSFPTAFITPQKLVVSENLAWHGYPRCTWRLSAHLNRVSGIRGDNYLTCNDAELMTQGDRQVQAKQMVLSMDGFSSHSRRICNACAMGLDKPVAAVLADLFGRGACSLTIRNLFATALPFSSVMCRRAGCAYANQAHIGAGRNPASSCPGCLGRMPAIDGYFQSPVRDAGWHDRRQNFYRRSVTETSL